MLNLEIDVNPGQGRFLALENKFRGFIGGYGSGKTWIGCASQVLHYLEHPGVNQGYFAPTYPQIRDIFYPTIEEVAYAFGIDVDIKVGNHEVIFTRNGKHFGTTICRSMDKPGSIVGFKIGRALIDELDTMTCSKAEMAWRKIIARLRHNAPGVKNGADITTTPEGFAFAHKLFVENVEKNPSLSTNYGFVQASTLENKANLNDDYISSLTEAYTEELVKAYINGEFVNLTSGTVYKSFTRKKNLSSETIKAGEALHIGMDFNVMHMSARIFVVRGDHWHCVDELDDVFDTPEMIKIIKERYPNRAIFVYPDATGRAREANNASVSDISLLEKARFVVRANSRNPAVKDRVAAVNKRFEIGMLSVHPSCSTTISCLEKQAYDKNGQPGKDGGYDHGNDAFGYPIAYKFPVSRPMSQMKFGFSI